MGLTEILVIAGLVFINGFFVAAEFALVKVRASQIDQLVEQGNWAAKLTSKALDHLDAYLSASQLGITVASLALGQAIEGSIEPGIRALLHSMGIPEARWIVGSMTLSIVPAIALSFVTFLHMALGEQAPKSLAIRSAKTVALLTAPPLIAFYYVFWPLIWLLNNASNLTLWLLGLGGTDHAEVLAHRGRAAPHRRRERRRGPPLAQRAGHDRERPEPRGEDGATGDGPPPRHRLPQPGATARGQPADRAPGRAHAVSRSARTT